MRFLSFILCLLLSAVAVAQDRETVNVDGLREPVEIVKDKWGISHIYAQSQADLFFAQGFNAARDRLFQFEIWRRKATGTLAEIMGPKALEHDKGARLLRFKNDLDAELAHYHEDGTEIINAFVAGVNAYIMETEKHPELLPFEFGLLGIKPGHWTPEIVISRHNALTGGVSDEIMLAQAITALGPEKLRDYMPFYRDTHLDPFDGIDLSGFTNEIMTLYRASRSMPAFEASDLANPQMAGILNNALPAQQDDFHIAPVERINTQGSNNWIISGTRTASGKPIMANDPHRTIQSPSLRYMVHLNAPAKDGKRGWNVIGGGEPVLPGVSIGHNEFGAWGLTIFAIDQEDLYVYKTNPDNPNQYWYQGRWIHMMTEQTIISVKGQDDVTATLKYSIHGPVLHEDPENNIAYGLKAAWLDIGATPYLASLRMDQAQTFDEFREACSFSGLPGENMVWADKNGTIGWQSVGLTPVRFGWDGSLPIPGDGEYEWSGYVPIKQMPHVTNPKEGWYGTANNHNVPAGYPNIFSDFYSDPARIYRMTEVLNKAANHTIEDSKRLQYDTKSMNAEKIMPYIARLSLNGRTKQAQAMLKNWDYLLEQDSAAAAIFDIWENNMRVILRSMIIENIEQGQIPALSKQTLMDWIENPPRWIFGSNPERKRNEIMEESLERAVIYLGEQQGRDMDSWSYGAIHYAQIVNPFSHLVGTEMAEQLDTKALPRGGGSNTLNAVGGEERQRSGASFRMIVDTADWDATVGTNTPGQSGNPTSKYYKNLFENWNKGEYFPMYYSRNQINEKAGLILKLNPN